jgi:hypothetical protein
LVTARTPHHPGGGDVSQTLDELERKLRQLEQELASTSPRLVGAVSVSDLPDPVPLADAAPTAVPEPVPAPAPMVEPTPPAPRPAALESDPDRLIAEARARLGGPGGLGGQVDELLRFREQLQRTARELEDEYSRVLARIGAPVEPLARPEGPNGHGAAPAPAPAWRPPPEPAPMPLPAPEREPEPAAMTAAPPLAQPPAPPFAPAPAADPLAQAPAAAEPPAAPALPAPPAPEPSAFEEIPFEGAIALDAGPFTDIATLSTFEQELAHVPGAEDVYVSGFEGNRAIVELRLAAPVALIGEMRRVLTGGFTVAEAGAGRVRVDVHPDSHPAHPRS